MDASAARATQEIESDVVAMPVNLRRPGLDSSGSFSKAESYVCASPADMEVTNRSQFRQPIWRTTVSRRWRRCCAFALAATPELLAQSAGPNDVELRKEAQNPIANLISVPFQNNTNFPVGKYARVQPVYSAAREARMDWRSGRITTLSTPEACRMGSGK